MGLGVMNPPMPIPSAFRGIAMMVAFSTGNWGQV